MIIMVPHVPIHSAAAARQRQKVLEAFRNVEAIAPGGARPLAELGLTDDAALRRLKKSEIVRELPDGRFYLDEDRLREMNALGLRIGLTVLFVVFLILVVVLALRP